MRTLLFSVKPDEETQDLIDSLSQLLIDQTKTFDKSYTKLAHLRQLHLEELIGKSKPIAVLNDGDFLDDLRKMNKEYPVPQQTIHLASLFIKPNEASAHFEKLVVLFKLLGTGAHMDMRKMLQLLKDEQKKGNTIFIISDPTNGCTFAIPKLKSQLIEFKEVAPAPLLEEDDNQEAAVSALSKAIARAQTGSKDPVNLGVYSHVAIVKALRHFLYSRPKTVPVNLNIAYSDGSQARPFPLLSLSPISDRDLESLRKVEILPVGQVTDRHPEMDIKITRYLMRNQTVSVSRPLAETDEVAYHESKKALAEAKAEGPIRIAFYQVGFQPTAIGFYRALAEALIESRFEKPWIEVIPYLYDDKADKYNTALTWS